MDKLSKCEIKNYKGAPAIFVNGEPIPPMSFLVREYFDLSYIKRYIETGHRICIFDIKQQFHLIEEEHHLWIDDKLRKILSLSDNLYIILAIYISLGKEWAEKNPTELCRYEDGSVNEYKEGFLPHYPDFPVSSYQGYYSFASKVFEKDACNLIRSYVRFINSRSYANRIIGYFLEAGRTHEWNEYGKNVDTDFSPAMHMAFRNFLRNKYKSIDKLRKAWKDDKVTFMNAKVPTGEMRLKVDNGYFRDPSKDCRVIDYYECHSKEIVDRMEALAKTIKEETNNKVIVGFYHGPTQDGGPGGYTWYQYIKSPYIDFAASPLAYEQRLPGKHSPLHHVVDSLHLHNKVFFSEDDLRPFWPVKDKRAKESIITYGGNVKTLWEVLEVFKKEIMQNVVNGVQGWWYDFHYKWYDRKEYWNLFKKLNSICQLSFKYDRRKNSEIAIIFDEESHRYMGPTNRINRSLYHRQIIQEMGRLGTTADMYLHNDLSNPKMKEYKLYIFLNCFRLTTEEVKVINQLKKNGHTLLFFYGQGYINDKSKKALSVDNMSRLIGINFKEVKEDIVAYITMEQSGHPIANMLPNGYTFGQHFRYLDNYGFPPAYKISPLFIVDDNKAKILGRYCYEHDTQPGMAIKDFGNWKSIYVGTIEIPAMLIRAIAKYSGCHLYLDTDDVVYINKHFLVIHASEGSGIREVNLPKKSDVWDLFKNKKVCSNSKNFKVYLKHNETGVFKLS